MNFRASILYGFFIWLVASIGFRVAGQVFFAFETLWVMVLLFGSAAIAIPLLTKLGLNICRIKPESYAAAAGCFASVGMILDAFATLNFGTVYANMPLSAAGPFAAYMLWCNAFAFLTGLYAHVSVSKH
jgi:hypothetical protein